jgi:hypothetical protein
MQFVEATLLGIPIKRASLQRQAPFRRSGAEKHEPDEAENQHRKPGGDDEQSKYGRTRLSLARFVRGFDDLAMFSRGHGVLASWVSSRSP